MNGYLKMNIKSHDHWLARLNTKVVFVEFTKCVLADESRAYGQAHYFGKDIRVSFASDGSTGRKNPDFQIGFTVEIFATYSGIDQQYLTDPQGNPEFSTFEQMITAINSYIKSRPFLIEWYDRGKYRLLDPEGMDYVGAYITLSDAKRTSDHNYRMKNWI